MDAVIMLDTTSPATVLGSIKNCLENQIAKNQGQIDLASLEYVLKMVTALHTMFSTQQPCPLYTSLQEFIKVTFSDSSILCPNRFKFSKDQRTFDIMCSHMNVILLDALYNIRSLASTCASGVSSAYSSDKLNSVTENPSNKKDEEERIKFGDFYDLVVDEEENGTHVRFVFNKEKYDKYWTQFKAIEKKYGWDKTKLIIRGL